MHEFNVSHRFKMEDEVRRFSGFLARASNLEKVKIEILRFQKQLSFFLTKQQELFTSDSKRTGTFRKQL